MKSSTKSSPSYFVGIGGSAGGLEAYQEFLQALPADTGMAFIVVAHMSPTRESFLVEILSRVTKMKVSEASQGLAIEANKVYIIAPNTNLSISGGVFRAVSPRTLTGGKHMQVDFFLSSLAENFGSRAVGVIFSGGDGDGTMGCKEIKKHGGITFAQDRTAEVGSMPCHASDSGSVDFVLSPKRIAEELGRIAFATSNSRSNQQRA